MSRRDLTPEPLTTSSDAITARTGTVRDCFIRDSGGDGIVGAVVTDNPVMASEEAAQSAVFCFYKPPNLRKALFRDMSKNLVIVESPAKCKTISKYLGKDYEVLASYGHVRDLVPKEGAVDTENEILIDRLLALESADIDVEQIKWVVLMVLFSQPGQEHAYARMEDLVFEEGSGSIH